MALSPDELVDLMEHELDQYTQQPFPEGASLYHYTDAQALLGILRERVIWATHYRYLNDKNEMQRGEEIVQEMAEELARTAGVPPLHRVVLSSFATYHRVDSLTQGSGVFVASFSERGNQLSQWRSYAANGAGYSIGFSDLKLADGDAEKLPIGLELFQCVYDEEQFKELVKTRFIEVLAALDRHAAVHGIDEESIRALAGSAIAHLLRGVTTVIPRLKHASFVEEREWRLVVVTLAGREHDVVQYRASPRGIVPFVALPLCDDGRPLALSRIYVGPTQYPDVGRKTCASFLSSLKYDGESIVHESGIPFRA
jgi:hypothetical protein